MEKTITMPLSEYHRIMQFEPIVKSKLVFNDGWGDKIYTDDEALKEIIKRYEHNVIIIKNVNDKVYRLKSDLCEDFGLFRKPINRKKLIEQLSTIVSRLYAK